MDPVRNSGKAIVIRDESILVIAYRDEEGEWFSLPGGGQEPGETLTDALQRECLEELGVGVEAGPLRYIREYIGAHHEFSRETKTSTRSTSCSSALCRELSPMRRHPIPILPRRGYDGCP
ncbi:MAG: NUDIX domain-containing protein [Chloroflexi bacterium]|nr:NUDIX domain-containing protein [Chloroflexota bacterium]